MLHMPKPIVDKSFTIQKEDRAGGWHYVVIPGIRTKQSANAGLIRVKGSVDTYELRQFNLLPMKNGDMLLPLKAPLRKAISKKLGDKVHVTLFLDKSPVHIPLEILDSLADAPVAHAFFFSLSDSNKKYYIDWVSEPKRIETKVNRIVKMIERLEKKEKFWDWPQQ